MDFILQREFFHPEVQQKMKRKKTSENVKFILFTKVTQVFLSCYAYAPKDQYLFIGLTNGKIYFWKKKNMEQKYIVDRGKEPELIEIETPHHHKVSC